MKDVLAPEAPPKVTFTEFNVRQDRGKPHFIRLEDDVVKRLEKQLAAEAFGLLLGSVDAGEHCTIAVDDFEPAAKLEDRIRAWTPRTGSQQKIVGYYRTFSTASFALDPADRALFERCFPKDSRVALLVKPPTERAGTAMFFVGENGRLSSEWATVEFPFNLQELCGEESPAPAPVIAPPAPVVTPAQAPAPAPSAARGGVFVKIAVAGVVVIASVFGLSELRVFDHPSAQPAPEAAAPANRSAVEAPAAPTELEPPVAAQPVAPKPQPAKAASAVVQPKKPAAAPAAPPAQEAQVAQNTIPSSPAVTQSATALPPVSEAQPRSATRAPAALPLVEERPGAPQPAAALPPAPTPVPKPVEAIPVTPPHVIRQFAPILTDSVRRTISGEVVVRVKVNVDASGKVSSAEPITGSSVSDALASTAVNAVKRWQFEPARRGGEYVPGDIVLSFTFRK